MHGVYIMKKEELELKVSELEMELRMSKACSEELKEENENLRRALTEISSLPGVRQDECCNIALGALTRVHN